MLNWISTKWAEFEAWLNTWLPGLKTKIMLALGFIGTSAASIQTFVTGLPVTHYITAETLSVTTAVLYALAYWLHGLGDRVEAREEPAT